MKKKSKKEWENMKGIEKIGKDVCNLKRNKQENWMMYEENV